jgi:multiple antibiotic resistance protein
MVSAAREIAGSALLVVGALFPIVNPLGNTPIFLTLTRGISAGARASLARAIAVNGLVLIVTSIFIGTYILAFFGISLPVVQVGGGLLVMATAWSLLRSSDDESKPGDAERPCNDANYMKEAFYPLTPPLTVGPGSISVAIAVGANRPQVEAWDWRVPVGLLIGAAIVAFTIWLSYRFAEGVGRVLGEAAMNVVIRLSSFILLCIGVQIAWNGLSALLRTVLTKL